MNPAIQQNFRLQLNNLFQPLQESALTENVEGMWSSLKKVYSDTAENVLGRRKRKKQEWISGEAWELIREKKDIKLKIESSADLSVKRMY